MKINTLLFTQTMQSLLSSSLTLQDSLAVCADILPGKKEKQFCTYLLNRINEGKNLSWALEKYRSQVSGLYIALVKIGEETGSLEEVFVRLADYLKTKKQIQQKLVQALAYPIFVLITALLVMMLLVMFILPRLNDIFEAFTDNSTGFELKTVYIKMNLYVTFYLIVFIVLFIILCMIMHKINKTIAFHIDSIVLKIPFIKKIILVYQMQDFAFSMKLLTLTHFSLTQSLTYSAGVITNLRLRQSLLNVCDGISRGESAGKSFEKEKLIPKYLIVWIKIAERNGNLASVFTQICDYYSAANTEIAASISSFAEPLLTLFTGIIIIFFMAQIIIPVLNILGAL